MKTTIVTLFMFIAHLVIAQTINQFDADGKRDGVWKKYFDDTKILRYEGAFSHGKEIGLFKFYKNIDNKASLTATKQFNSTDNKAYVTFYTSMGKVISEGEMDGKTHIGGWKYYQKNSKKLLTLENYDNAGNLDGDRFVYYNNGQIAEKQHYEHGKLNGTSVWYSPNNTILKEFIYVNGELDGVSKYYDSKGNLIIEGSYKNGKKHGIWNYYEDGKLVEKKDFTHIQRDSKKD
ncbi:toxin-antitoxin system YwqK family antitoxin [Yeosuana marina]|uniref:toxin-antitoxin system YwqK family antitoxin n=1 Tax=Yeosuana marina TaxID=1565536 RepID=UPI0014210BF5|nr:toxin-antitoxin system YwqK family antitoxin [Yeosuana marina]